ncbi:ribbon-helix-helix domain-containing protein [Ideonella dechloratans]|uniref:Ribbon-helix-helix domain-containing protein n=1 Tax=Ideonella dechloratans TaxID=36863 RepID=A0A643FFU1_IDEDE|nr:ribbon-helix-helix domain-containing protein [Ideonella dechloratans]KAB0584434.1 ribbon-helix-helix domain-containing protein [Ideonella dechloratans]UFU10874.1 ribbon-helix-helix domain-containing protein [Ideonella dechloratans]
MCEIFIGADPLSYESRTRSVRLHGVVTSIRLEHLFWDVLDEIARRDGLTVVQLIEKLYDELIAARGEAGNFASFLRVSALRYEALLAHQAIPADVAVPLRGLDARAAVKRLPAHWQAGSDRALRPGPQGLQTPSSSARSCAAEKSSAPV